MKIYRVSRSYLWARGAVKVVLTAVAAVLYIAAVTNPTPFPLRLLLLVALAVFGWLMYVRAPRMPTEITLCRTRVHAADIRSIGRGLWRGTVRVRHSGGRIRLPNRFRGFYDFLAAVKSLNPSVAIRGF
jgi:hypothetical protein